MSGFPEVRLRRLRQTAGVRRMLDAPLPGLEKFIWPVFVAPGRGRLEALSAMPGQFRYSPDTLLKALEKPVADGLGGVLLFGVPEAGAAKDNGGGAAADPEGVVQRSVLAIRTEFPELTVFTDVCLCAYTEHGHCGPLDAAGRVDNDAALERLAAAAVSHAAAGAQAVAPSAMMDGQVRAIRSALDAAGLRDTVIMSYSTKFASSMYGPFREAEGSAPQHGDRRGYQASYANPRLALRESQLDEAEGADILMVKPALFYLDLLAELRRRTDLPLAAYNVSGEYAMLCDASAAGHGDLRGMVRESLAAIARAGADIIISYWASRYNELLRD